MILLREYYFSEVVESEVTLSCAYAGLHAGGKSLRVHPQKQTANTDNICTELYFLIDKTHCIKLSHLLLLNEYVNMALHNQSNRFVE